VARGALTYTSAMRACLLMLAAACGGPTTSTIGNQTGATARTDDPLAMVLAPRAGNVAALSKYITKSEKAGDPLGGEEPAPVNTTYDFDGDKIDDLTSVGEIMYGPSQGWNVSTRTGTKLEPVFGISGDWADAGELGSVIAMRFQANTLAPGEARFSLLVRYDRTKREFLPIVKAYVASQTEVPVVAPPFTAFTTTGAATLRAMPVVDDTPIDPDKQSEEEWNRSATLRGNVVATYGANARGLVLASKGEWRYVAFDFATRPDATSLAHGMDAGDGGGEHKLASDAWLCGWIKATEIR
jgi:hypothetical protein